MWIHNLDPFALQLGADWGIRWYGLAYLAAFAGTYLSVWYLSLKGRTYLKPTDISDYVTYGAIGALAGARLGYAVFYSPSLFIEWSSSFPYWEVLSVHKGGMASHGGLIGVIAACYIFAWRRKLPVLHIFDLSVFGASIGFFCGRMANFVNGELYGRPAPADLWWGVKFPSEIYLWGSEKLKSLGPAVEAMGEVQGLKATATEWEQWIDSFQMQKVNFLKHELVMATQRGQAQVLEQLGAVLTVRYPSQLVQAFLEGLGVLVLLSLWLCKARKPGTTAAWFAILYSVARIVGEQFRMPDAHIGFGLWGLTRGQWLSCGLLVFGLALMLYSIKKSSRPL